jgi:carbon storage regulator
MGLLVLTRSVDQDILIDPDGLNIRITLVALKGDRARIGIDAPRSIPVHRYEVWQAVLRERGRDADDGGPTTP